MNWSNNKSKNAAMNATMAIVELNSIRKEFNFKASAANSDKTILAQFDAIGSKIEETWNMDKSPVRTWKMSALAAYQREMLDAYKWEGVHVQFETWDEEFNYGERPSYIERG